ncbi:MAG TPA: hypothetical protein VF808_07455 [Ktedonobacterales bacterium]
MRVTGYHQFGGWALLINGVGTVLLGLLGLLSYLYVLSYPAADTLAPYQLVGLALFILGLPVIQLTQTRAGRLGWLGIGLMELGAVMALVYILLSWLTSVDTPSFVPFTSALAGLIGDLLVGYLTVRVGVFFPKWAGWSLAAAGLINFTLGLTPPSNILGIVASLFAMLGGLAIVAYAVGALSAYHAARWLNAQRSAGVRGMRP